MKRCGQVMLLFFLQCAQTTCSFSLTHCEAWRVGTKWVLKLEPSPSKNRKDVSQELAGGH